MLEASFKGGVYIANPYPLNNIQIEQVALPKQVVLCLQQSVGGEAKPCVNVGERVLTGQVIAQTKGVLLTQVHASISGVVTAIEKRPIVHPSGLDARCIVIDSDGKDEWIEIEKQHQDFLNCTPEKIRQWICEAGIVGMGGAGFPTHTKIQNTQNAHTLIINATECEPGIMCDDSLMQTYPREVMRGVEVLMYACGAKKAIVAIEEDKTEAFNALLLYKFNDSISIKKVPTKYTSGAEKILIKALLGVEISSGAYAADYGILCQNVGTVKAIYDAVIDNKPLISRIVTVTGSAVKYPKNYEVRLGTAFAEIVKKSQPNHHTHHFRVGGMMMGIDIPNAEYAIGKTSNCIFVNNIEAAPSVKACIRCSMCATVCPVNLLPQQLFWYAKSENIDKAQAYHLNDCIECGCCDYVCPSNIPLTQYFNFAKALGKQLEWENQQTNQARARFEFREYRLQRHQKERSEMMAAKKKALKEKMAKETGKGNAQQDKIAQAMARIKKTKEDNA